MIGDHRLPTLVRGLQRARIGIRDRLLLRDLCVVAAVLAGVVGIWRLTGAFLPEVRIWSTFPAWTGGVLGVAVVVLAVGLRMRAGLIAPTVLDLARRADERFELQERLSTALEVTAQGDGTMPSRLRSLLLSDAARVARVVEPASLVQVPLGRPALWLVVALAAALAVQLVPVRTDRAPTVVAAATGRAPAGATSVPTVTDVQRAAALVAQDAFVRNDPQLQALAQSLQDLGARMASGRIQSGEVVSEVAKLRLQLEAAYGQAQPHAGQQVSPNQAAGPPGSKAGLQNAASAASKATGPQGPAATVQQQSQASSSLSDLVKQLEAGAPNQTHSKAPGAGSLSRMGSTPGQGPTAPGVYARQNPAQNALFKQANALLERSGNPGGQPVGAAHRSTMGPGDAAGKGTQPLVKGVASPSATAAATGAKVDLPSTTIAGGQRIQVDAAPIAKRTQVTDVAPGAAVAGAPPSETARPTGPIVDPAERFAVARYFLPPATPAPGTSSGTASPTR